MHKLAVFSITSDGKLCLDGTEIKGVEKYRLSSSAKETAELELILTVKVGQVGPTYEKVTISSLPSQDNPAPVG